MQQHISRLWPGCLAAILSCAISNSSQADQGEALKLPPHILTVQDIFYPGKARRLSQQGRVLVEFQISAQGRVTNQAIISAEPRGSFEEAATRYVAALGFEVPSDWESSGASQHRFRLSVVFALGPCRNGAPCDEPSAFPADASVKITAPSLGR